MEIISAIAALNALAIAFLLSTKKNKAINDYILIAWVVNFAFQFAIPFCIERHLLFSETIWGLLLGVFIVAHAPFVFVYTTALSDSKFKTNIKNFYHFGFILIFIGAFIPYLNLSNEEQMNLVLQKGDLSFYMLLPMLSLLFISVYFFTRTIIILVRHQYSIKQSYSHEEKINLAWIKLIACGFLGTIVLTFVLFALASAKIVSIFWMDYILVLMNVALFFYIAFSGYKQNAIKRLMPSSVTNEKKTDNTITTKTELRPSNEELDNGQKEAIEKLLQYMENNKPYLQPELNIGDLANHLKIHAHQLSKLINSNLNKSFFEFVNEYRVEEFKKLVANPKNKHISLLGLAMDAGFNSKSSFNRTFKTITGLTPSEFKENFR